MFATGEMNFNFDVPEAPRGYSYVVSDKSHIKLERNLETGEYVNKSYLFLDKVPALQFIKDEDQTIEICQDNIDGCPENIKYVCERLKRYFK